MPSRAAALLLLTALFVGVGIRTGRAERVKDLAVFEGVRANQLVGYGVVVGLTGTGDDNLEYVLQGVRSAAQRLGVNVPTAPRPSLKNSAAVLVTAELPAFAKPGQTIDVTISALGKAKSLRGGTLIMTRMVGADNETYAVAQGSLTVGGLSADGRDGSKVVVNTPSSGRIPDGATVERAAPSVLGNAAGLKLNLRRADFTDATRVASAINRALARRVARAIDPVSIVIDAPDSATERMQLMAAVEAVSIDTDTPPARIIINARTGTIVIGGGVRVMPAAVAHGSLTVRISEDPQVVQPAPFSRGQTAVVPDSSISVDQEPARAFLFNPGVKLSDIVDAINRVGASPSDLVAILEALKQAGALKAELVVI